MKRHSTLLVIKEKQTKTTMKHHIILAGLAEILRPDGMTCQRCEARKRLLGV